MGSSISIIYYYFLKNNYSSLIKTIDASVTSTTSPNVGDLVTSDSSSSSQDENGKRSCIIFDSTIAAYLMMSNLAPGLKKHAVSLYEVGKISDEALPDFIAELDKVDISAAEGDAQSYAEHALTLRRVLHFLRKNENCKIPGCSGGVGFLQLLFFFSLNYFSFI